MRKHVSHLLLSCLALMSALMPSVSTASFVAFESGHVRPLAMSPDGNRLFVVNTPDNRLEIFDITQAGLVPAGSVPVGMEPVAVAARSNSEVWVVNHLSDSISIVDVAATPPRVTRTLLVGDEPRDIVFAGTDGDRAFITTAHRGQNSPYLDPDNPGEFTTPGIGRADVWVFDATELGTSLGGDPLTIVTLFGDTPRPLAVSPDGSTVYAGIYHSGNRTTTVPEGAICDGFQDPVEFCNPALPDPFRALPPPNADADGEPQPQVGLIVRFDGTTWKDELGRNWNDAVRFNLPDKDVFAIDANADPPAETAFYTGVGTILYNMAVNPDSGKLFVANTEAINEVRFEGTRTPQSTISSVIGHQHETRITIIDPGNSSVTPRHLNKHIDYSVSPAPAGVSQNSLALPRELVFSSDGNTLYLAAKGSDKVGIFDVAKLEDDSFVPDSASHVHLSGGGPAGLLLDEARGRLYVTTRFDNGLSIVDTALGTETAHIGLANPEPPEILTGRRFLYDANLTSSNGEAACASCHVDGDLDSLAWDLGNPDDSILNNPLDFTLGPSPAPPIVYEDFHPMKGPMTTQTLRGMDGHGSMHWRGDRTFGNDEQPNAQPDNGAYNEFEAFKKFAGAFEGLLGRATPASTGEIEAFASFILQVLPPPNPIRNLNDLPTPMQQAGETFYMNEIVDTLTCNTCHVLDPNQGFFGTDGRASFEGEPQHMKIPHLRNMYAKVGMFGMPAVPFFNAGNNGHQGDQIRGFGFLHDGSTDTLLRFLNASLFNFPGGDLQRQQVEQFLFAFDSNLKPVVGQQITLTDTNAATVGSRIGLLIDQAKAGNADLVVKGVVNGEPRGWRHTLDGSPDGVFESDKVAEADLTDAQLRALANVPGQVLTYTAVPPGSGVRMGINRDEDGLLDGDDNCPAVASADQTDTDGDNMGDVCDWDDDNDKLSDELEATIGTNPLLADTDSDGMSDGEEVGFDGDITQYTIGQDPDPNDPDSDNDGLLDGSDPIPLTVNVGDGDLAPWNAPDGTIDAADVMIATQITLGTRTAGNEQLAHGDLFPPNAPDGVIDIRDMILLLQLVLQ